MFNIYINDIFLESFIFFNFIFVCFAISVIIFVLSYFLSEKKEYIEKLSIYECGFDPFDDARNTFDVHFYLIAMLFLIFDLEISFLFPWSTFLLDQDFYSLISIFIFLIILTLGFIYELVKGALEWS